MKVVEKGLNMLSSVVNLSQKSVPYFENGSQNDQFARDIFICVYGSTLKLCFY